MGHIGVLPEHIVNKIAAGEVIERPSSVVKELVENSLDANSSMISISIKHGGKGLIKVVDNGTGMDQEDALLCLKSHATSKIKNSDDIFTICSLGFRGEALSSIAAVSRITLLTRHCSQQTGTEIEATGGKITSVKEKGTPVGTSIEISDLFFNTPARKKFQKGERAEHASIAEAITTISLAHTHVAFKLYKDGQLIVDYPTCSHLKARLLATHYHEWVKYLLPIDIKSDGLNVRGYVAKAELSRINRSAQLFFINKRPVKSLPLSYALQRAYQGLIPQKHFPVAIIFLELDPTAVDVNIHPTKREVRLQNEKTIYETMVRHVRDALHKCDHSPSIFHTYSLSKGKNYEQKLVPTSFNFKEIQENVKATEVYPEAAKGNETFHPMAKEPEEASWFIDTEKKLKVITPLGQIRESYLLAETEEGFIVIDQHAAHERIIYEEILTSFERGHAASQALLLPATIQLNFKEAQILEEHLDLLIAVGFDITNLGNNTFSVDATPALMGNVEAKDLLLDFLHGVMDGKGNVPLEERKGNVAKTLACKSRAIKANEKMSPEEIEYLINSLEKTKQPFTCPHGRPTFIKLTISDLEKYFKRK